MVCSDRTLPDLVWVSDGDNGGGPELYTASAVTSEYGAAAPLSPSLEGTGGANAGFRTANVGILSCVNALLPSLLYRTVRVELLRSSSNTVNTFYSLEYKIVAALRLERANVLPPSLHA